jgi:hypothetical protein
MFLFIFIFGVFMTIGVVMGQADGMTFEEALWFGFVSAVVRTMVAVVFLLILFSL